MRLHTYRDESRSRHFDLIGGRGHPWSIDLVTVTASGILVMCFAFAIASASQRHAAPLLPDFGYRLSHGPQALATSRGS